MMLCCGWVCGLRRAIVDVCEDRSLEAFSDEWMDFVAQPSLWAEVDDHRANRSGDGGAHTTSYSKERTSIYRTNTQ
jgi:hypothetical protein